MNEITQKLINQIYDEFYSELLSEDHYAVFFKNLDVKKIHQQQVKTFFNLLEDTDEEIRFQGLKIGAIHVTVGLPFEDLYSGYQKLHKLIPKYLDEYWISQHNVFYRLNLQRNAVAEGYLEAYVEQLKKEVSLLISHREKVLTEVQAELVNKPLCWILKILEYVQDTSKSLPEMKTGLCPLNEKLENCKILDKEERRLLLELHHTQHVMGTNFLFFVNEKNFPLAVFLLSRFYGRTLDLSNRIGLSLQYSTIHELQKDALTGFYLRHDMETSIELALSNALEKSRPLSILMLDIDHFKNVNDAYGHQAGDKVLQQIAKLISLVVRASDKVFRFGGEEFLILLENADQEISIQIAERLRKSVEQHQFAITKEDSIEITASVGLETFIGHEDRTLPKVRHFISDCDAKLYKAKENGRNRVEY